MGCASERKSPVPEKKQKLSTKSKAEKSASATGKYFCLECLEDSLLGKKEEKFAAICRGDSSSVARHKARWHKIPESQTCTIVPSTSPEVNAIRNRCARPRNEGILNVDTTSDSNTTECSETSAKTCSKEQQRNAFNVNKKGDKEDAVIILPNVRAQTTLLSFKQAMERFVFEDCDVRTAVLAMREARNVFQLVDAPELFLILRWRK